MTLLARFEAKYVPEPNSGCWLWTAALDRKGYGAFAMPQDGVDHYIMKRAHRVSYELARGPLPIDVPLDHLCRTRSCVNPDHLEPVTTRENLVRGWRARKPVCPSCGGGYDCIDAAGRRRCRSCRNARRRNRRKA